MEFGFGALLILPVSYIIELGQRELKEFGYRLKEKREKWKLKKF